MDILAALFQDAGLVGRVLDGWRVPADRALRFPCERSLGVHVVLAGTVHLHAEALAKPLALGAGDVALMGRGCTHVLSTRARLRGVPVDTIPLVRGSMPGLPVSRDGDALVVSGAYQLWHTPVHPLFAELPPWHVRRAAPAPGLDPLALSITLLADELRCEATSPDALGRTTVVHGLLDVLFMFVLRECVAARGAEGAGWSHAIADGQIRQAVALLHGDVAREWTLPTLAAAIGVSRSVLAARFREQMGETPLAYLRTVRLQRAMRLLVEGAGTLEQVAAQVGYGDAFGFSKAFKRAVGISPGEFRRRDVSERAVAWRFLAG